MLNFELRGRAHPHVLEGGWEAGGEEQRSREKRGGRRHVHANFGRYADGILRA